MLDALKKKLLGEAPETVAEQAEVVVEAATQNIEQSLATDLQGALAQVEQLNATLQERESVIVALNSKLEALSEFAAQAEAAAEAIRVTAENKALEVKREKLANVIGSQNPGFDATFAAISNLDDASFDVVVGGFAASFAKEAESELFNEVGVSGEAEVKAEDTSLNITKYLKKNRK